MKFVVDAQLPPAIAQWLKKRGYDAVHVHDIDLGAASDETIRHYVIEREAALLTKDRDFVPSRGDRAFTLIWVRTGNVSNTELLRRLETAWPRLMTHLQDGAQLVELR